MVKIKSLIAIMLTLSLGACATVPPPPHCEDNGQGLQPINPEMMSQEQVNAIRSAEQEEKRQQAGPENGGFR